MTDSTDTGSIDGPATNHPHYMHMIFAIGISLSFFLVLALTAMASEDPDDAKFRTSSQQVPLLTPHTFAQAHAHGGVIIEHVDDALISVPIIGDVQVQGTIKPGHRTNKYIVQSGDTITGIANKFNISQNTVKWANDLTSSRLKLGQELTILPVSGVIHTVKSGDTLGAIAKKYEGESEDIALYNQLESDTLKAGTDLTIPGGVMPKAVAARTNTKTTSVARTTSVSGGTLRTVRSPSGLLEVPTGITYTWKNGVRTSRLRGTGGPSYSNYYTKPINTGRRSRGLHGFNAVDWAAPKGTPIVASAPGKVIVSKKTGWNGGYGRYTAIEHANGSQTLYAHASSIIVARGQNVVAGQVIGYVGSTGNSSGNHLHFEVRGAKNPF